MVANFSISFSALTRYEFAADINACLERVNQLIATATTDLVKKEDLATLQKLQEQFAAELTTLRGRLDALSNCDRKTDNSPCDSRNPYNLVADTTRARKIRIAWDVCQKNDFYQVSWGDDKDDMTQIDDPTARSWTYTGVSDVIKYTFKVRGCNAPTSQEAAQEPDCTPWTELVVTTPDW